MGQLGRAWRPTLWLFVALGSIARASTPTELDWCGLHWDNTVFGFPVGDMAVTPAGQLVVCASRRENYLSWWGLAHHATAPAIAAAQTPWVLATVDDPGPGAAEPRLYALDRVGEYETDGFLIGAVTSDKVPETYQVFWFSGGDWQQIPTSIARTAGRHTFVIGRRPSGGLTFLVDGRVAYFASRFSPIGFDDVLLEVMSPTPSASVSWLDVRLGAGFAYQIDIDIKPGSGDNPINPRSRGRVPVAVLSRPWFDATSIDPGYCWLAGAPACQASREDVDGDGHRDLLLHFETQEVNWPLSPSRIVYLRAVAANGVFAVGTDLVTLVGKP